MKSYQLAAVACALICTNGIAAAKSVVSSAPFKLTGSGEGRWAVKCELESGNGLIDHRDLHPDKSGQASLASDKFKRVSCDYRAATDKPLTLAIEGDGWACPLRATTSGKCEQAITPGVSANFIARPR
jgi:hypothetical protein